MPKSPDHRTGLAAWDGQLACYLQSPRVTATGSAVTGGDMIAPCDGEIVSVPVHVITDGSAATALINLLNGATEIVVDYDINAIGDGSKLDLIDSISAANRKVQKGDRLFFNLEATAAGVFAGGIVIMPRGA